MQFFVVGNLHLNLSLFLVAPVNANATSSCCHAPFCFSRLTTIFRWAAFECLYQHQWGESTQSARFSSTSANPIKHTGVMSSLWSENNISQGPNSKSTERSREFGWYVQRIPRFPFEYTSLTLAIARYLHALRIVQIRNLRYKHPFYHLLNLLVETSENRA